MSFESYAGGPGFLKVAKDEKEKSNTARNIALGLTGAAALGGAAAYTMSDSVKNFVNQKAQAVADKATDLYDSVRAKETKLYDSTGGTVSPPPPGQVPTGPRTLEEFRQTARGNISLKAKDTPTENWVESVRDKLKNRTKNIYDQGLKDQVRENLKRAKPKPKPAGAYLA